jgi:hypothetical protein
LAENKSAVSSPGCGELSSGAGSFINWLLATQRFFTARDHFEKMPGDAGML